MAEYILAHDLGTSGNKATLFSTDGVLIGSRTVAYPVYYDQPLWAEQDPEDWWCAVCSSTKELIEAYQVSPEDIKVVSFSGQMMGALPVDRDGKPLMRSIIWADMRAGKQAEALREKIDDEKFYKITGHRNTASYGIQKAMWLKENRPEIYERTYKFLNAKDYIVYKLTGKFYTDCSDANSMDCLDLAKRKWSEEIVEASQVAFDKLPEIVESTYLVGNVTKEAAEDTGLSVHTKVVMGAGDGVAANVGAGSVAPGKAYCCMGTSAWVAATSDRPVLDEKRRIVCWAHAVPGMYSPNGTMQYAGGSYSWLKNTICLDEIRRAEEEGCSPYELMNEEISQSAPGAEGLLFLPHLMGERAPRWNSDAKGVFFGLTATTERKDILRSVMEGILMNLANCFEILKENTPIEELLLIGGSAKSDVWQQAVADIYGVTVNVPRYIEEANSMGAAVIAGVGSGIYEDFSAIEKFIEVQRSVEPDQKNYEHYKEIMKKYNAVYDALLPLFGE
ncbi:MAG: xylulokinase [Lachnospiraceae bacterium]|nr:xylulokinase [Lachnospiraceae bacterium]